MQNKIDIEVFEAGDKSRRVFEQLAERAGLMGAIKVEKEAPIC